MHLINARTYKLEYFVGDSIPPYAILSHVWGNDEVLFRDLYDLEPAQRREGFTKIRFTCQQALQDGLSYAWVDTCCIDKESSAQRSEAINSMFRWYSRAAKCYAYLSDVERVRENGGDIETQPPFTDSIWFTRGWTLQELIAPRDVVFLDRHWVCLGTKQGKLLSQISGRTAVDKETLADSSTMFEFTIAKRMSWAAGRETTRKEDEAYSLLGILSVNMPMLYGEERFAFIRLQEELIRRTTDQSIFVHRGRSDQLLADSPADFADCADVMSCLGAAAEPPYELTNAGLRITLPVLCSNQWDARVALNCQRDHHRLVLCLESDRRSPNKTFLLCGIEQTTAVEMLTCRIQEIFVARNHLSYDTDTSGFLLQQPFMDRVWLHTTSMTDDLRMNVETLEPLEYWDVAPAPPSIHNLFELGYEDSSRNAFFTLPTHRDERLILGRVKCKVSRGDHELMDLTVKFQFRQIREPESIYEIFCRLELSVKHHAVRMINPNQTCVELCTSSEERVLSGDLDCLTHVSLGIGHVNVWAAMEPFQSRPPTSMQQASRSYSLQLGVRLAKQN